MFPFCIVEDQRNQMAKVDIKRKRKESVLFCKFISYLTHVINYFSCNTTDKLVVMSHCTFCYCMV